MIFDPLHPRDVPPTRWIGPTQQGVGLGRAPCHCVWRRRLVMKDLRVDIMNPFSDSRGLQSYASHQALKSQVSDELLS